MGELFKKALDILEGLFKGSLAFKIALLCIAAIVVAVAILIAYPSIRHGAVTFSEDISVKAEPELYDVFYDFTTKTVKGKVSGVQDVDEYRVILFILTDQWYVKPDFNLITKYGMSEFQNKDSFLLDAFTEGQYENDIKATKFVVFLVPASYGGLEHMNDYDGANAASIFSHMDVIPLE